MIIKKSVAKLTFGRGWGGTVAAQRGGLHPAPGEAASRAAPPLPAIELMLEKCEAVPRRARI